jgi:CDP-glycerol glycerophosphotransferase (TagB/SpsB family)
MRDLNKTKSPTENKDTYYFVGNITSHALHLLPLHKILGGKVVVLSEAAKREVEKQFELPVICLQDSPETTLEIESKHAVTFDFLEKNASQIIFYEIFKFKDRRLVPKKPVTFFLTHGNMLKNYMNDQTQRSESAKDYDYIAGLGPFMKAKFIKESNIPQKKILDVGIARTDDILDHETQKKRKERTKQQLKDYGLKDNQPIVSYLPTYWGDSSVYNTGLKIALFIKKEHFLIVRTHPQTNNVILFAYKTIALLKKNVLFAPHGSRVDLALEDVYAVSDAFIGDISSVMLEAILLKKPLLFAYGSGGHRQDAAAYEAITGVVRHSYEVNESSVKDVSNTISTALDKGISENIWSDTISSTFFLCGGRCAEEIARQVRSLGKISA